MSLIPYNDVILYFYFLTSKSLQDICLVIALRVRSATIVVRSGIFLVIALVSRTVSATSKFHIAAHSKPIALQNLT